MAITIHNIDEVDAPQARRDESASEPRAPAVTRRAPPRYQSASIVSVYLPEEVVQAIDALRGQDGRTRSELIAGILKSHVCGQSKSETGPERPSAPGPEPQSHQCNAEPGARPTQRGANGPDSRLSRRR